MTTENVSELNISAKLAATCGYGENPYQTPAGLYSPGTDDPLAPSKFKVLEGKPPSYNNYCDLDRLLQTVTHIAAVFDLNAGDMPKIAVGVKHGNPCGAAIAATEARALADMLRGDPLAIFGGLVMTNFAIGEECADVLSGKLLDGIIAPNIAGEVIEKLRRKGDKCRFITNPALAYLGVDSLDAKPRLRYVRGEFLRQPNYTFVPDLADPRLRRFDPAGPAPSWSTLFFAWAIGSTSNSNTITLVKDGMLIGNGVGQQDRVGAAELAISRATRAKHSIEGASAYSDSFFPFPDGPETLANAGVKAIFTSSGSVKDQLTIDLCAKRSVSLWMIPDAVGRGFLH